MVDWRLSKIHKELKSLNLTMGKTVPVPTVVTTTHESAPCSTMQLEELNITFDGERYVYGEYKYDKLSDAISYAKKQGK